jgi:FkbM family methyltransferase
MGTIGTIDVEFIEIGTADFDTLAQQTLTEDKIGICVEPIKYYLDRLPNTINILKANYAISDHSGYAEIYYIPIELIQKYNLPWWIKGCGCINSTHINVNSHLMSIGLNPNNFYSKITVSVRTYAQLIEEFNVAKVNKLKIDAEGHDLTILDSMMTYCCRNPEWYPVQIQFESNNLHSKLDILNTILKLKSVGYKLQSTGNDTIMFR